MRNVFIRYFLFGLSFAPGLILAANGPVTLVNAHIEVGVDPRHGLILRFGLPGKPNLLWVNPHPLSYGRQEGWIDYGGDKLWWGPQIDWQAVTGRRFPPDESLDGAWEVTERGTDRLVMRSSVSPWVGIRAEREVTLASDQPMVVIRNHFVRETARRQRLQLWTVCQMPPPKWCWLDSQPAAGEPPFVNLRPQIDPGLSVQAESAIGMVRCKPSPAGPYLVGTRGAWIAAIYDELIVVHQVEPYPDGAYAEHVSLQLFFGPQYVELETLGGLANPKVGESMSNTVRWRVLQRPRKLDGLALGSWLRAQLGQPASSPTKGRP